MGNFSAKEKIKMIKKKKNFFLNFHNYLGFFLYIYTSCFSVQKYHGEHPGSCAKDPQSSEIVSFEAIV
jgi:hypothetical protein